MRPVVVGLFLVMVAGRCWAHKPLPDDGTHVDAEHALHVEDIGLSQVVYHEAPASEEGLWLSFDGKAGKPVYFQLGVPKLARLQEYRPTVVLLGPGLPVVETPCAVPEGLGGVVFPTDGATPELFHEHFTGTESWILLEQEVTLPTEGQCFVVVFEPGGRPGKYWVAIGKREEFTLADFLNFAGIVREVRAFHEVDDERPPVFVRFMIFLSTLLGILLWPLRILGFVPG